MLSGYKTYIVAGMCAMIAVLHFAGVDIPGTSVSDNWVELLLGALGLGALRSAVSK